MRPEEFLSWAERIGLILPADLIAAVEQVSGDSIAGSLQTAVSHASASNNENSEPKSLKTRERDSLLKLVIGLAMRHYDHDPRAARNSTSRRISDDLAQLGISIDEDTVRRYLSDAREVLPDDLPE